RVPLTCTPFASVLRACHPTQRKRLKAQGSLLAPSVFFFAPRREPLLFPPELFCFWLSQPIKSSSFHSSTDPGSRPGPTALRFDIRKTWCAAFVVFLVLGLALTTDTGEP